MEKLSKNFNATSKTIEAMLECECSSVTCQCQAGYPLAYQEELVSEYVNAWRANPYYQ